ncbi:MAG: hypothetical protein M3P18_04205 [Actinomycetota bacterium]|nr:hypothetical protein [Actinomycetota bacterium]
METTDTRHQILIAAIVQVEKLGALPIGALPIQALPIQALCICATLQI